MAAIVRPATAVGAGAETGVDKKAGEEPVAKVEATDPRERQVDDDETVRAAKAAAGTKAAMVMGDGDDGCATRRSYSVADNNIH